MARVAGKYGIVLPDAADSKIDRERKERSPMSNTSIRPYSRTPNLENSVWYQGHTLLTYLATNRDTGGQFALLEVHSRKGGGPPPHIHPNEDECFFILEGEMEFIVDGRRFSGEAGSFVFIPRGTLHQPLLVSEEARALVLFTPGGAEGYFEEMAEPARAMTLPTEDAAPPDLERMAAVAKKYGSVFPDLAKSR
jgi:quercetin dioxygenase-like cupin family protein